jgi:tRNA-dihydrouridine synthase
LFTEFVSVDALAHAHEARSVERIMRAFIRARDVASLRGQAVASWPHEVAQVFGHTPELFYQAAVIVAALGFDGMDINMGCPAKNVAEQGSGAGLIRTPEVAQAIIRAAKQGMQDWAAGKVSLDDLSCSAAVKTWAREYVARFKIQDLRFKKMALPVSVKTRIGVDHEVVEAWMETLMDEAPATISLHGRTLKQLYEGQADWEAIARAARVVHARGGHILGNGDVKSAHSARLMAHRYGVDGVLIGRAAEGNPGIFKCAPISKCTPMTNDECTPLREQRLAWAVEHARVFEDVFVSTSARNHVSTSEDVDIVETCQSANVRTNIFIPVRKHLAWYCHGFPGAVELRTALMRTTSASEVSQCLETVEICTK